MTADRHRNFGAASLVKRFVAEETSFSSFVFFVLYVGVFIGLIAWFKKYDLYHAHFSQSGGLVLLYNVCRALFIFYLFWIVHTVGSFVLGLLPQDPDRPVNVVDSMALAFFSGAGLWHIWMLILGYLNLYYAQTAVICTVPLVGFSFWNLRRDVLMLRKDIDGQSISLACPRAFSIARRVCVVSLAAVASVAAFTLLLVKGLYPAGGHDYFVHYFSYLKAVIAHHGIWPNEVWYHYYYSKGAGLDFLAILLTDPLAPQLVTICFFFASTIALFRLLQRISPSSLWPLVGIVLYLGIYIYTPGEGVYRANGGWGDFEKLHELTAALVIAIVWMTWGALESEGRAALSWTAATTSAIVAAVIISTPIALFLGATFAMLTAWYLFSGQRARCVSCFFLAAATGVTLLAIFALNYVTTGLINDEGILTFWRFANLEKLYSWGALPWVILLHWATTGLVANSIPISFGTLKFLVLSLRLDLLGPLVGGGTLFAAGALVCRRRIVMSGAIAIVFAALIAFLIFGVFVGRSQPISFFRFTSFMVPIMIVFGVAFWGESLSWRGPKSLLVVWNWVMPWLVLTACMVSMFAVYPNGTFRTIVTNALDFAAGRYSIDKAYTAQNGWPGRLPWGGIYPGARGAYQVVGPGVPIWSLHVHSYCMLPDCQMESYFSFSMTRDWDKVMFGSPEEAKIALQKAGINYFLFSRELAPGLKIRDALPLSPLFSPKNISKYLGIRWTDGKTVLLTWRGPNTIPFDGAWLRAYRDAAQDSTTGRGWYAVMKRIFARLRATPHPWQSFDLPWEGNRPY